MFLYPDKKHFLAHVTAGLVVFIIVIGITELIISLLHDNQLERQRSAVVDKAAAMRAEIEGEINSTLHLTRGLIAYVATHPDFEDKEFSQLASEIIFIGRNIRNIGLAKHNIITHIYPLAGNEAALGLEYQNHSEQWPAVKKAIELKGTVVAGPVRLVQGGQAFIARTPIYTRAGVSGLLDKHKPSYWGIASIVINMSELFQAAGFYESKNGLLFALRGKEGLGAEGEIIMGNPQIFDSDPVLSSIKLPNGSWQIAALPQGGWGVNLGLLWVSRVSGWIAAILFGILISALLIARERNRSLALHDHLTNLPNRRLLEDRLEQVISHCQRDKSSFGLFYLDLDGFKFINDQYGHEVGDSLLIEASKRMQASIRVVDTVSRVGGDEFIILTDKISQKADMQHIYRQLKKNLSGNVFIDSHKIAICASIGSVIYPDDGKTIDELLRNADKKMYSEKQSEKMRVVAVN